MGGLHQGVLRKWSTCQQTPSLTEHQSLKSPLAHSTVHQNPALRCMCGAAYAMPSSYPAEGPLKPNLHEPICLQHQPNSPFEIVSVHDSCQSNQTAHYAGHSHLSAGCTVVKQPHPASHNASKHSTCIRLKTLTQRGERQEERGPRPLHTRALHPAGLHSLLCCC
jgi:hypothetical protein